MADWVRVVGRGELGEGQMRRVVAAGVPLVVAQVAGEVRAFAPLCPHASAELADGTLRPGYVICPLHAYRFELRTGRCVKPPDGGPRLRIFPAELRGDGLWVYVAGASGGASP